MDFSNEWRSLWPISSAFAVPNLLSAAASETLGPLLFHPSPPLLRLLSSPSLALQIDPPLPPPSLRDGLRAFFRAHDNDAFIPSATEDFIAADALSSFPELPTDPIHTNNLHALRCRDGSTLALFFPTGPNADSIGYLTLSFKGSKPEVRVTPDGDVFKQTEGFKHRYQRIFRMSLSPAPKSNPELSGNSSVEGLLLATTMYSMNWFRFETLDDQDGQPLRPSLIPVAKQGFDSAVVHACWSPHFPEESAALLDNGDLCWFNLNTKRGGTVRVALGETEPGEWLSCEFGGQPWILIVACSTAVVSVDLRLKTETPPKFLARFDMIDSWSIAPALDKSEPFIIFCKASFSDFHVAVVSKNRLFVFDTREPLVPVLTWDHGLERPSYVSMFRLSELRSTSDEFQWASESGFAILVGSFWDDEFNLCCYGPKGSGAPNGSPLYAWELPSRLSLSGRQLRSSDSLVKEVFSGEDFSHGIRKQQKKNVVVGFFFIPSALKLEPAGFSVIRLMLSGKLEMQNYHASWNSYIDRSNSKDGDLAKQTNSPIYCMNQEGSVSTQLRYLKLQHLYEYMCGDLTNALARHVPKSNKRKTANPNSLSADLVELSKRLKSSTVSPALFISDASIPTSIFEIASRKVLAGLKSDMLSLSFSKYSDLQLRKKDSSFEFLEVPSNLPHHSLPPFFMVKPSMRSEKWTKNAPAGKARVGPILPLPVLVALQEIEKGENTPTVIGALNDDSMAHQCKMILENVFPEISIADGASRWDADQEAVEDKPFFVYEPTRSSLRSSCRLNGGTEISAVKQEFKSMDPLEQATLVPAAAVFDKKHTTFICGIADKTSYPDPVGEPCISDMLNLSTVRLDFDPLGLNFQAQEKEVYMCLKKQFAEWQDKYKPYENFCTSFNIPKLPP